MASQKNRPVLFGTPVVVPCTPATPCRAIYDLVWQIIRRLIIPDKPSPEYVCVCVRAMDSMNATLYQADSCG